MEMLFICMWCFKRRQCLKGCRVLRDAMFKGKCFFKRKGGVWQGGVEGRQFSEGGGGHKEGV